MNKEERKWILNNVEEICIDTKDVDEISIGLEHLSIFASEAIKDLATTVLDLQSKLDMTNKKLVEVKNHIEESLNFYLNDKDLDTPELRVMQVATFKERYLEPILEIIGGE